MTANPLEASLPDPDRGSDHGEAVSALLREHNRALHAFLMSRVGDEHEAREVAQEAYVRLLQLEQPGAVSFLRAYLFKTAANIAVDRARTRCAGRRAAEASHPADAVDELSPDRYLISAEDLKVFKRALLELSPKCRRAFLLCRIEGQSDEHIAGQLGIKPRMVRHYLRQAGLYCRLRIKGFGPEQAREATR